MNVGSLSRVIGTALAGALLAIMSLTMLYVASFIAYFFLFIVTLFLQIDETKQLKTTNKQRDKASFKEVLPVIKGLPIVLMTLIMTLIPLLFIGGFNLMVINISELHQDSTIKAVIYSMEGISFIIGAFFVKKISEYWSPYTIIFFFSFVMGVTQLSLYFVNVKMFVYIPFAIFGFSVSCFFPTAATIFQTKMPKEFHGRFFSFRNMLDRIIFQVVLLGTGLLLDMVGLQMMVVIFGMISLTLTFLFYFKYRRQKVEKERSVVSL